MRAFWWGILTLALVTWLGAFLNDFSAYLARDLIVAKVGVEQLTEQLINVLQDALQPEEITLWLKK